MALLRRGPAADDGVVPSTITELTTAECEQLLHAGAFGRLVLPHGPRGAEILPVNYTTVDHAVLVHAASGSILDAHAGGAELLFEVDHVDYERAQGWSVVARGRGERVTDDERTEEERHVPGPPRWLDRDQGVWIRLTWDEVTGRRVGEGWDCLAAMPVRRAPMGTARR